MKRKLEYLAAIVLGISGCAEGQKVAAAYCGPQHSIPVVTRSGETQYHGEYCNYDYAYRVLLPMGVVAHGTIPPHPNHGFGVLPAELPATRAVNGGKDFPYLHVDASFASDFEKPSLKSIVDAQVASAKEDGFRFISRSSSSLGGLRSYRLVFEKGERVSIVVVTYRPKIDVIYTIELLTAKSRRTTDEVLLNQLVAGFSLQPEPKP